MLVQRACHCHAAADRDHDRSRGGEHGPKPLGPPPGPDLSQQPSEHLWRWIFMVGARQVGLSDLLCLGHRYTVQHGRQHGKASELFPAAVALVQVRIEHAALVRLDRANHVDAEQFTEISASLVAHGASPRSSRANFSALSA